jgi:3-deoxy-7-phosphoheptulonate synthase
VLDISGVKIGGKAVQVIAGPCSVEGRDILLETAREVKSGGATLLRGGAFKPRTSPYSFQGLGEEGLKYLAEARKETGLPVVTELMDPRDTELLCEYADVIQIGARNMQNFRLLTDVGNCDRPVLLKRGLSATIKEFLMSAEYIASRGNKQIILCERGIRTFETSTRNTLDLSSVPVLKEETHLPVFIDPSHAVGRWELVGALSKASVAVGADGLMIEVHNDPENALCDGAQSLKPDKFVELMAVLKKVAEAVGRTL